MFPRDGPVTNRVHYTPHQFNEHYSPPKAGFFVTVT